MSDEQQPQTTTPDTLRETPLASTISDSLSTAIAAQTGTSAQNIANQIQQAVPFKEIIEQLKNEIDQSGTQLQNEIAQQALIQQAIANFGSPTFQTTTTRRTTNTDTPNTKKTQMSTEPQQPKEIGIKEVTPENEPSAPSEETPSNPQESVANQNKPDKQTEPDTQDDAPADKVSKPSVDDETDTQNNEPQREKINTTTSTTQETEIAHPISGEIKKGGFMEKQAQRLGDIIGQQIAKDLKECKFRGFIAALFIAMLSDVLDTVDTATLSLFVIFVTLLKFFTFGAIWAILLQQGNFVSRFLRRMVSKKIAKWVMGFSIILDFLPFTKLLPSATILVMWTAHVISKEAKKLRKDKKNWEKVTKKSGKHAHLLNKRNKIRWDTIRKTLANKEQNAV